MSESASESRGFRVTLVAPTITRHHAHRFENTEIPPYDPPVVIDAIRGFLAQQPFRPFRVRASTGKSYLVRCPNMIVLLKSWVFVASPNSDRFAIVPYLHIASVESVANRHRKRSTRRTPHR